MGSNQFKLYGIVIAISLLLFILSWSGVDPLYYGLKCNVFTKKCDQTYVYTNGRYLIGPLNYFLIFPAYYKNIEFSDAKQAASIPLKSRTKEGLSLGLHITFQYHIQKEFVPKLYQLSNLDYEATFIRIARNVILKISSQFEAPDYWKQRQSIANKMKEQLDIELQTAYANCVDLQLLVIDLPNSYENIETQVQTQMKFLKEFEQKAEIIRQQINELQSENQREINIINATAQADAVITRQKALANAQEFSIQKESEAYQHILKNTEIKPQNLSQYIIYNALMDNRAGKILIGVDNVLVNNQNINHQ